jgi:hypothetical protein
VDDWSSVQIMIKPIYDNDVDAEYDLDLDDNEEFVF